MTLLTVLDRDVEVVIRKKPRAAPGASGWLRRRVCTGRRTPWGLRMFYALTVSKDSNGTWLVRVPALPRVANAA